MIGALHFVTLWWLRDGTTDTDQIAEHVTTLLWSGLGGGATTP